MEHSAPVSRRHVLLGVLGLALLATSCASGDLAFVQDERLEILEPPQRVKVTLPVTVRWRIEGFESTGEDGRSDPTAGSFAVFVNRTPVPPGEPLSWLAREDRRCKAIPGCPDEVYLADRNAYKGHETHEVTIVLLDGRGRRIGESAWHVTFFYDRAVS